MVTERETGHGSFAAFLLSAEGLAHKNMADWWKHWKWPPSSSASDNMLCLNQMQLLLYVKLLCK